VARSIEPLLPLAARTADTASAPQSSPQAAKGIVLVVNLTVRGGAETITPIVQVRDNEGNWVTYATFAATGAVGGYVYVLRPGITVSTSELARALPNDFRILFDHSASDSHTYSARLHFVE
jgi:hypothetical protein